MKKILFASALFISLQVYAQTPDDALRNSWFIFNGTARTNAIGGAMGSLGGDISAANINPAGIGLYKTREIVLSPSFLLNNNQLSYRGSDTSVKKNNLTYGPIGIIIGTPSGNASPNNKWVSSAFSLSVTQLASYNNHIQYSGINNQSSFSEQYLEELARDAADTNAALSNYIFGSSLAFRTYLIDTTIIGGQFGYKSLVPVPTGSLQTYDATTSGGYNELALGFASNMQDKLYVGGSVTIPIINYKREFYYSEKDANANPNNNFSYFNFHESFSSSGFGVGLKLGTIYKPTEHLRLGFAIHTPQFISYKDEIRAYMTTNTENYAHTLSENSDNLNNGNVGTREYNLLTPWRAIISGSFVFNEVSNTKKQKGFISADIEYVNYRGARYSAVDDNDQGLKDYLQTVNDEIKDYNKANINVRLGGEIKFAPWAVRLGFAYYGSPYADASIKANKMIASGGFGYRNHGFFIDLAYSANFITDANFPYRLNDKPNTYAVQKGNVGNIALTFGFKF
jgi:long-subunit fatty acid transport protein